MSDCQTPPQVLLVDDDGDALTSLARALKVQLPSFQFHGAARREQALALLAERRPHVAVLDLSIDPTRGVESGFTLLTEIVTHEPGCRIIVVTGHGSVEVGVRALQLGAASFVEKPADIPHLAALVKDGAHLSHLLRAYEKLRTRGASAPETSIIGESAATLRIRESVAYAARTSQAVLITGETGTGKGLTALAIHELSARQAHPLIRFQPSFGSADLVNSQLFGHLRGAFTGASDDRTGLLVEADGGSLFLDEIDELPLDTQVTLLGVLQEKRFRPLGSNKEVTVDVRIMCATNQDPMTAVAKGKLRKDFYHRIAHCVIHLPPLRERASDIPSIATHLLARWNEVGHLSTHDLSPRATAALMRHDWPGNIRELEAVLEGAAFRAQFAGRRTIEEGDLTFVGSASPSTSGYDSTFHEQVENFKLRLIESALTQSEGNQAKAAQALGLERSTLRRFLQRLGKLAITLTCASWLNCNTLALGETEVRPSSTSAQASHSTPQLPTRNTVMIEEMTWIEVRDALRAGNDTVLIPSGGVEQNGPYVALGKHNYIVGEIAERIARKLGNALVAPVITLVPEGNYDPPTLHMQFPGTISAQVSTFKAMLRDTAESFRVHGATHIVMFGDSGDNQSPTAEVTAELNARWNQGSMWPWISPPPASARVFFIPSYYNYPEVTKWIEEAGYHEKSEGIHDSLPFTLQLLAINPSLVRYEERKKVGLLSLNGVSLEPLDQLRKLGEQILERRAEQTATAIRVALGRNTR